MLFDAIFPFYIGQSSRLKIVNTQTPLEILITTCKFPLSPMISYLLQPLLLRLLKLNF